MRILLIGSYAPSILNFRGPLIRALLDRGHAVTVSCPGMDEALCETLRGMGVVPCESGVERTGLNPLADLRYMSELKGIMREHRIEFVLTYTAKPNIWGSFAARALGIPCAAMVTGLGLMFTGSPGTAKMRVVAGMVRRLYRRATDYNRAVVFQNPDDLADFVAAGCLGDRGKATIVDGSGVDTGRFGAQPLPDEPVFLLIARLLGNKGVREYGEASLRLGARHPHARFLLGGFIDEGHDSIAQAELDRWVAGGVEYLGSLADVREALAACSVYVLPSYREGTPRTVLEAMATGRAIVTTDAPGCRETTQEGVNGLLVPVADVDALERAMERLLLDPAERRRMGAESRRIAEERYDAVKVSADLVAKLGL